jgi:uncharacterized protein (DUF433 family)
MVNRITIDPNICHGKPVISGTRIRVSNILSSLAAGETFQSVIIDYPGLKDEDIRAVFASSSDNMKIIEVGV